MNFNEIATIVLVIMITGSMRRMCKSAFDHKTVDIETGCDLINQKLFPSSDIDGAVIKVVALAKQKISAMIPAKRVFGIVIEPSIEDKPSAPVTATNIPSAKIKTTPIIVFMRYAGVVA